MESSLYDRIQKLCEERGISISRLESDCGLGNSTIKKWKTTNPNVNKIKAVALYFGVTVDYLLGMTTIPTSVDDYIGDNDIVSLQRARSRMSANDRQRMMQMLRIGFEYAFKDDDTN
mgnify:CR=1 FL=1